MTSFNFRSIQSLELSDNDNPVLTFEKNSFLLTATRGEEQIQISAPIDLLKVVNHTITGAKPRKFIGHMPGGDKRQGEANGQAKLTEAAVREIRMIASDAQLRNKYPNNNSFYKEIAKAYGVNMYTVINVVKRISWKHIN